MESQGTKLLKHQIELIHKLIKYRAYNNADLNRQIRDLTITCERDTLLGFAIKKSNIQFYWLNSFKSGFDWLNKFVPVKVKRVDLHGFAYETLINVSDYIRDYIENNLKHLSVFKDDAEKEVKKLKEEERSTYTKSHIIHIPRRDIRPKFALTIKIVYIENRMPHPDIPIDSIITEQEWMTQILSCENQ